MVPDYAVDLYGPAARHQAALRADADAGARSLAAWRRRVLDGWHRVHVDEVDAAESVGRPGRSTIGHGTRLAG